LRTLSKKQKATVAGLTLLGVAGTGSLAYAYWTTTGAGSGSGTTAASNGTLVLHASFPTAGLHPGGSVTVSFTADNASATDLQVGTVTSVVSSATPGCDPTWFSIAPVAENQVVPAGSSGVALAGTGTLFFANAAVNQNACKSANVTLTLSS
jgi:hypothetical protein